MYWKLYIQEFTKEQILSIKPGDILYYSDEYDPQVTMYTICSIQNHLIYTDKDMIFIPCSCYTYKVYRYALKQYVRKLTDDELVNLLN